MFFSKWSLPSRLSYPPDSKDIVNKGSLLTVAPPSRWCVPHHTAARASRRSGPRWSRTVRPCWPAASCRAGGGTSRRCGCGAWSRRTCCSTSRTTPGSGTPCRSCRTGWPRAPSLQAWLQTSSSRPSLHLHHHHHRLRHSDGLGWPAAGPGPGPGRGLHRRLILLQELDAAWDPVSSQMQEFDWCFDVSMKFSKSRHWNRISSHHVGLF